MYLLVLLLSLLAVSANLTQDGEQLEDSLLGEILCPFTCTNPANQPGEVLYVWSGFGWLEKNPLFADFVAVVDFQQSSSTYGQVISSVPIPSLAVLISLIPLQVHIRLPSGNEPHHGTLSSDGRFYATGGLLSFLQLSDEIFVWDVHTNPYCPSFVFSCDPIGACTDEFVAYTPPGGNPGWLVSQMCSGTASPALVAATSPGAMVFVDPVAKTCTQWSKPATITPSTNFDPHGFSINLANNSLLVTDYILPLTLAVPGLAITMRNTLRQFNLNGQQTNIWDVSQANGFPQDAGGFMDTKFIPGDNRAYTCGSMDNKLYLIDPTTGPQIVFDLTILNSPPGSTTRSAGIVQMTNDGTRLIMTYAMRHLLLFDITVRTAPVLLQHFDFCDVNNGLNINCCQYTEGKPGSHYTLLAQNPHTGNIRIVVVNYFLDFVKFQYGGNKHIYVFNLAANKSSFAVDPLWTPLALGVYGTDTIGTAVQVSGLGVLLSIQASTQLNITKLANPHSVQYKSIT